MEKGWLSRFKGLWSSKKKERDFKEDYDNFVRLLAENDYALELINELQHHMDGQTIITIPYLRNITKNLVVSLQNIVGLLNTISRNAYAELNETADRIAEKIRGIVTGVEEPIFTPTAVFIDYILVEMADKVGDKMANLGEVRNRIGLPVPDGFATTVCAYAQFMEYNNLEFAIQRLMEDMDPESPQSLAELESKIKTLIHRAVLPYDLASSLRTGCERIAAGRSDVFLSFRSSALGEDAESSFAGQYSTLLNVPLDRIEHAYKEVVASKYNGRAIYYRHRRGYRDQDVAMSVGVLQMIPAVASGVIFTADPNDPSRHVITVSGVWGLGQLLVDGEIAPDTFVVDKDGDLRVVEQNISTKRVMLLGLPGGGLKKVRVAEERRYLPCLEPSQLKTLCEYALQLEEHYHWPQDIEWAVDRSGTIYVLQTRPLSMAQESMATLPDFSDHELLLHGGETACSGVGAGPVFRYRSDHALGDCPNGAVLVAQRTSPRFVKIMDRVSAIVTNVGSLTDHMSSLAREFHVPTLVNTRKATKRLKEGEWVIVDATRKAIYRGGENEVIGWCTLEQRPLLNIKATESHRLLRRLIPVIVPLNLVDPNSPNFTASQCQTMHDIVRFAHEMAMRAMYEQASRMAGSRGAQKAYRLESDLPLFIYLIDLDGCVEAPPGKKNRVTPDMVRSDPFQAFWRGLTHEGVRWNALMEGKLDLKGFFSAMSQSMVDALVSEQSMGSNYFITATQYLNASFRFGYHFTTVDSFVSSRSQDNYIVMTFKGGAAPEDRRLRRIRLIQTILERLGFEVKTQKDFLRGRYKYGTKDETLEKLDLTARLIGATRLVDMALTDGAQVEICIRRFFEEDYTLGLFDSAP